MSACSKIPMTNLLLIPGMKYFLVHCVGDSGCRFMQAHLWCCCLSCTACATLNPNSPPCNVSSKTILPMKCQKNLHGMNAQTLFSRFFSRRLSLFLCLPVSLTFLSLCLLSSLPSSAAADLFDPVVVSFRVCLLVIKLHYLCCIVFHHQFPQRSSWDRFLWLSQ